MPTGKPALAEGGGSNAECSDSLLHSNMSHRPFSCYVLQLRQQSLQAA